MDDKQKNPLGVFLSEEGMLSIYVYPLSYHLPVSLLKKCNFTLP